MPYSHILFDVDNVGIALITVNRPAKLNALSSEVITELDDAFARVSNDSGITSAIVTGAGEKAFVAGADINELAACSPVESRRLALRGQGEIGRASCRGRRWSA